MVPFRPTQHNSGSDHAVASAARAPQVRRGIDPRAGAFLPALFAYPRARWRVRLKNWAIALALASTDATAQDYRLVLTPAVTRTTAIDARASYGDDALHPARVSAWRYQSEPLYVPTGMPSVVYDAAKGISVGYSVDIDRMRSYGHVWLPSGEVITVYNGSGWNHACILGTHGTTHVGRLIDSAHGAIWAARWDSDGGRDFLHPTSGQGWEMSVAEDVSPGGVVVGWARPVGGIDSAVVWTGPRAVGVLEAPEWASVQARAVAVNDNGQIVGDATGAVTRPIVWLEGQPVVLADTLGMSLDVNRSGLAVGWLSDGTSPVSRIIHDPLSPFVSPHERGIGSNGVLWNLPNPEPVDLHSLIDSEAGLSIIAAYCVSERGDIGVECVIDGVSVGGVLVCKQPEQESRQ